MKPARRCQRTLRRRLRACSDNGKPKQVWLKRSLATKDHSEAKRRVKAVQIEFDPQPPALTLLSPLS